ILLPNTYGSVATVLDKALSKKLKVACLVVENKTLRKVKTRGVCKVLRSQNANCEITSFEGLKQGHNLRTLLTTARAEKADILVILEKRSERSFVILDTRNAVVLGHGSGSQQQLVPGNKTLLSLHESLCKTWTAQ
ncbi:MAG: hypothetical protein P1V97_29215, partial [Planctomycetota bacterium]|nr:hypothetical protein [Planctomycetota bacterium]